MVYENREFMNFRSFREFRKSEAALHPAEEKAKRLKERLELRGFMQERLAEKSDLGFDYAVYLRHGGPESPEQIRDIMHGATEL